MIVFILILLAILVWVYLRMGIRKPDSTVERGKKVILFIVDSLLPEPLESLMVQNKAPAFSFLQEQGSYTNRMCTSFPTMSVTIESTLFTGTHPDQHGVPGLRWYSFAENRLLHYGDGVLATFKGGLTQGMLDGLFHLNNTHLSKKTRTIHEELASSGRSTASINTLVYRSHVEKKFAIPWPFPQIRTKAPPYFVLGNFYRYLTSSLTDFVTYYGVNNKVSIQHLVSLIKKNQLPSFTSVYLSDLDRESHKEGGNLESSILKVDQQLQEVLQAFGDAKQALEQHILMVMGDSGVSKIINDNQEAIVDLDQLFHTMKRAPLGRSSQVDEIALAVNERMSYIYPLQDYVTLQDLVARLKPDKRLDTICWKEQDWVYVVQGGTGKELRFRKGSSFTDEYQQQWDVEGEMDVLDLTVDKTGTSLTYGSYPDALMRLYAALHSHEGSFLVVTTLPGYEMKGTSSPIHVGGGAHGAFHEADSCFPMFIAGTTRKPKYNRVVDMKEFILELLQE